MFLLEKLFRAGLREAEPRRTEERFLHVGYLGEWGLDKPHFKADLSTEQEHALRAWFQSHRYDPGISCEMDAIKKLYPDSLIQISDAEAVRFVALSHQDEMD